VLRATLTKVGFFALIKTNALSLLDQNVVSSRIILPLISSIANNQCTMAMALLGRLARKLLKGETSPKIMIWKSQDLHLVGIS
jgi:hypothetical protein